MVSGGTSSPIKDQLGRNRPADSRQEIGRAAIVNRHHDDAAQETAPERDDPFRPVLAPEQDLVAFMQPGCGEARREPSRRAAHLGVRIASRSEAIVVDQKFSVGLGEVVEKIDQRVTGHR